MVFPKQQILVANLLEKGLSTTEIAERLEVSKQRVSNIKKELVKKGVLKRWVLDPKVLGYNKKVLVLAKTVNLSATHPNLTKRFNKFFNSLEFVTQKLRLINSEYNLALLFELKNYSDFYKQSKKLLDDFQLIVKKWTVLPVDEKVKLSEGKGFLDLIINKIHK